jgi:hypothetical protein
VTHALALAAVFHQLRRERPPREHGIEPAATCFEESLAIASFLRRPE